MPPESSPRALPGRTWKRRLTIGDGLILIAVLAVDLTGFRNPLLTSIWPGLAFVGLFVLGIVFVWLYVPKRWEKVGFRITLSLYFALLAIVAYRILAAASGF